MLGQMLLTQRSYDAAIASFTKAVAINANDTNKRELDGAYDRKKRAQAGTSGRIAMEDLRLERVFVSAHKQYATEPLGRVKVRNDSGEDLKNLKLSFFIKEYMDFPVTKEIPELKAKSAQEMTLNATFNNKVLGIDEDTRVLVVATLAMADARDGSQEITQAMTLYGKNAIVWSNSDMIGSFVTPRDDTLRNFVRESITKYGGPSQSVLNRPLSQAATLFNTLSALGLRYQPDPNTPFSRLRAEQVDYIQFPRETLKLKSGDCDDLSVLLAAGFENLGIEAALVEVPGHLFLMFRTGLKEADRGLISLQDELFVLRDGEVWIPLEATLIATSFTEAWAEGARKYHEAAKANQAKVVSLRKAWEKYAPATLAPSAQGIDVPVGERVTRLIGREKSLLLARRLEREVMPPSRPRRQSEGRRRAAADRHHLRPQRRQRRRAAQVRGDPVAGTAPRLGAQQPRQPVFRERRFRARARRLSHRRGSRSRRRRHPRQRGARLLPAGQAAGGAHQVQGGDAAQREPCDAVRRFRQAARQLAEGG
jgi:hypothetical protein